MTSGEAVVWIRAHSRYPSQPGLARMRRLMKLLGNPQERMRFVHIAGTNGKGSTAVMTAAALTCAGYRTGVTISPYIIDFRERIQIDGEMISTQALAETVERIRPLAEQVDGLVEFEVVTAVAFDFFAQQGCEIVVAEVGLGGRLDATNVIPPPVAAAITSISLDHTSILGDTIAQIAVEKCGIIKPGTAVVTAPGQEREALEVIRAACAETGCMLREPDPASLTVISQTLTESRCVWQGREILLPLGGVHQQENLLTAFTLCKLLAERGFSRLTPPVIARGIEGLHFPVRLEWIAPDVFLDGAHNPGGARALAKAMALTERKPVGVIGMLADKDSAGSLSVFASCFSKLYCVAPDNPRALDAVTLAQRAGSAAHACDTLVEALALAREDAARENRFVVVCGSRYLAAEARNILKYK